MANEHKYEHFLLFASNIADYVKTSRLISASLERTNQYRPKILKPKKCTMSESDEKQAKEHYLLK